MQAYLRGMTNSAVTIFKIEIEITIFSLLCVTKPTCFRGRVVNALGRHVQ